MFDELILPHLRVLHRRAHRLERSRDAARDLVQDTVERALRHHHRLRPDTNVRTWLLTVMFHLFVDRCRRRAFEVALETRVALALPAPAGDLDEPGGDVGADALRAALARLEPRFREVIELHFGGGCRYREVSARLGLPMGTVATRLLRARRKLRELL